MPVVLITPPEPVVSLDEAKKHIIIDHNDDDDMIGGLIAAATAWIDGPAGWLGRAVGVQVLEWQLQEWPCNHDSIPFPPQIEVLSVTYVDPAGLEQSWPVPTPLDFANMPQIRGRKGDIRIRYRAGYGVLNSAQPPIWVNAAPTPVKVAILMLVAQWYRTREPVAIGSTVESLPFAVDALLSPYRVYL